MSALGEISCGAHQPSTLPVWRRELLNARDPPRVTCMHGDYDEVSDAKKIFLPLANMIQRSFFFGPNEVASIRTQIPYKLRESSSDFEIITSFLWRCRTMALQFNDDDKVPIRCAMNGRSKFNPPLPKGYYGNVIAHPMVATTAGELLRNPLGYALELEKKLKGDMSEEYMHSLADFVTIEGRPSFNKEGLFCVSDVSRAGFIYMAHKNAKGQKGVVIPLCLPGEVMKRFVKEFDKMLKITSSL